MYLPRYSKDVNAYQKCVPIVKKTAVYTNVNGYAVSYTSKTAKIKKGDITQQHIDIWLCVDG